MATDQDVNITVRLVNTLSTTGPLTLLLIDSYHEMFTCLANYDISLRMLHHKLSNVTIFLTFFLIGSINDRIFRLTNQRVALMELTGFDQM